jgi:hypothetical protein
MVDVSNRPTTTERSEIEKWARERAEMIQGLYIHLMMYLLVNAGLFTINWVTTGGEGAWWFQWPLMGWGIGMLIHVLVTVVPVFSKSWVDRRAEEIARRYV